jgi:hemerythrin-like metal-binding protein
VQCLEWKAERNAVAVPEIDQDHRELFQLGNELYQALAAGALLNTIEPEARKLIAHTLDHFKYEERMMRSKRYRAYGWHKGQHDTVRARLAAMEHGLEQGDREELISGIDYLTAWLQTHTAVSDRMMGAFLRTLPPPAARRKK